MIRECGKGQGALEYLLLIGGSVVVAVIVIFIVMGLAPSAGNAAQTGLESYREVTGIKVTGNPTVTGGSSHAINSDVTFSANPSKGTAPYTCDWDFGDGTIIDNGECQTSHTYTSPYSGDVTVTITDSAGDVSSPKKTPIVIAEVGADISFGLASPVSVPGDTGETGSITVSCINKQPADATCNWAVATTPAGLGSFAEGGVTASGDTPTYNLDTSTPGTYSFTLTVDSPAGSVVRNSSVATNIEIALNLVAEGGGVYATGSEITFSANPSNGSGNYSCDWDFGDGTDLYTDGCPTSGTRHTYSAAGPYTVAVTVTGAEPGYAGSTDTTTVEVIAGSVAQMSATPAPANVLKDKITLSCAGSTPGNVSCAWAVGSTYPAGLGGSFEGGISTGNATTPVKYIPAQNSIGFYTFQLTVDHPIAGTATATQEVEVYFKETFDDATSLNRVTLNTSEWQWFDDGGNGRLRALPHPILPDIALTVTNKFNVAQPYSVETDFNFAGTVGANVGLISNASSASINYLINGAVLASAAGTGKISDNRLMRILVTQMVDASASKLWSANKWNHYRLENKGNVLKAYVALDITPGNASGTGQQICQGAVCQYLDATPLASAPVGIRYHSNISTTNNLYVDNLEIHKLKP